MAAAAAAGSGPLVGAEKAVQLLIAQKISPGTYNELMAAEAAGTRFDVPALLAAAEKAHLDMASVMSFDLANAIRRGEAASATEKSSAETTTVEFEWHETTKQWMKITHTEATITKTGFQVEPMGPGFVPSSGSTTLTLTREQSVDSASGRKAMVQQLSTDGASTHGSIATLSGGEQALTTVNLGGQQALPAAQAALPAAPDMQNLYERYCGEVHALGAQGDPAPEATWALVHDDDFALLLHHGLVEAVEQEADAMGAPPIFDLDRMNFTEVPMTAMPGGVDFGPRRFRAVDRGSVAKRHHNMCFYLSVTAGDAPKAIALKERLAPLAGYIAQTFGVLNARFQAIGAPADIEVILAYVWTTGETVCIASLETGKALRIATGPKDGAYLQLSAEHFTQLVPV